MTDYVYVYKGHDAVNIQLQQVTDYDDISMYEDARYVSPPEAFWHLTNFKINDQSHVIFRLKVHLQGQQSVYFLPGLEEGALNRVAVNNSHITAWFDLNIMLTTRELYFTKISQIWVRRKRRGEKIIGRMYNVSPNDVELFHLRVLLLNVPGATSFVALNTSEGRRYFC